MKTSRIVVAAEALAALGKAADAVRLVAYAQTRYADFGATEPWVEHDIAEIRALALDQLGAAGREAAEEAGRGLTAEEVFALAHEALANGRDQALGGTSSLATGGAPQ
jgi:hypothetical protein